MTTTANEAKLQEFFAPLRPWMPAYSAHIAFVAFKHPQGNYILAAKICLGTTRLQAAPKRVYSRLLIADTVPLAATETGLRALFANLLRQEECLIGEDRLKFLKPNESQLDVFLEEPTPTADLEQPIVRLIARGQRTWDFMQGKDRLIADDLQMQGYASLNDLMSVFGLVRFNSTDSLFIELNAQAVIEITPSSRLTKNVCEIQVRLPRVLEPKEARVSIISRDHGPMVRVASDATVFHWNAEDQWWLGCAAVHLTRSAIVQVYATYSERLHDTRLLRDLDALPNMRRRLLEFADPNLTRLRGSLIDPTPKTRDDFDVSVASLLFALGFECIQLRGKIQPKEGVADLLCIVGNDVLIIECTTKVLDPDGKVNKLIDRVQAARTSALAEQIDGSPMTIVGMLVVPQKRSDIVAIAKRCAEHEIIVLAREELECALEESARAPNPRLHLNKWRARPLDEILTRGLDGRFGE